VIGLRSQPIEIQPGRHAPLEEHLLPVRGEAVPPLFRSFLQYKHIAKPHDAWCLRSEREAAEFECYSILNRGRLGGSMRVTLDIDTAVTDDSVWDALQDHAREKGASVLHIEANGRSKRQLPTFKNEKSRHTVQVYSVDLAREIEIGKRHRRNVGKARKRNVSMVISKDEAAIRAHVNLCRLSVDRRENRGEAIEGLITREAATSLVVNSGARLFQATLNGQILSSDLVVFVGPYAFYDSGGTSPEGMQIGSSYFLMASMIEHLKQDNMRILNLGVGAENRPGLSLFKSGFGADCFEFQTVEVDTASRVQRLARRLKRLLGRA